MEAPRASADIPLSKTLVALKRVRSLRDPSTNSMNKFPAAVENLNSVANSLGVAHLDTSKHKHHAMKTRNYHLKEENEDILSNSGSNLSSRKPFPRSSIPEKTCGAKVRGSKATRTKLVHKSRRNRTRRALDSARGQHFTRHVKEEVDSYREPELNLADRVAATGKKSLYDNFKKPSPMVSRTGSPCMSASESHTTGSRRHAMGSATVDLQSKSNDVVGSNFSGCGISYCCSGTPKYKGQNIYSDEEEDQGKPLLSVEQTETARMIVASYPQGARSLSKKFRPKSFEELVGLNVLSQSLLHAVTKGKIAPVYLFHGPQGNGKTSTARIFAAALNCLTDGERRPCGFCRECVLLFSGRSRNVRELDAAKINHKERLKSLLQSASVVPCMARFEVFIIDECQSLREEAWTAIFKTLDEQPEHAVFVMITSDLDALPRNCISQCQRFHFPKIKEVDTVHRLEKISIEEELQIDGDALKLIATKSNGSVQDAETMLDQLVLLGKRITVSLVIELIGVVSDDELLNLLDLALSSDTANTVRRARELMMSRIDPLQLVSQLANVIMDILSGRSAFSEIGRSFIQRHAASDIAMQKLRRALKVLSETEKQLRSSKYQATWLTVALLQLSTVESSPLTETNCSHACSEEAYLRDDGVLITGKAWEAKRLVCCPCNQNKPGCSDGNCYREKLECLWRQVTQRCQPHSFKSFLQQEGCLSAVYVHEGVIVAEIKFHHPDHVSRAVKSQQLIASALQHVLGSNLEIRIKFDPKSIRKVIKPKKTSFSLLSCSARKKERPLSTISNECETDKSAQIESSLKIYSTHQAQKSSPFISQFGDKQLPDDHNMKAMITRKAEDNGGAELIAADGRGHLQKDGKVIVDCSGKLSEVDEYISIAEPETQPTCFPRKLRFQKNFFSSNTATICLRVQQHNKPELSIPDKEASDSYFCMYDPYALNSCSASQFTCSSREENLQVPIYCAVHKNTGLVKTRGLGQNYSAGGCPSPKPLTKKSQQMVLHLSPAK